MPSFRIPAFLCRNQQQRRSFQRLRSFHLTPADGNPFASHQAFGGGTNPPVPSLSPFPEKKEEPVPSKATTAAPANMLIPLRGSTVVILAIIASIIFVMTISFAFIGADSEESYFVRTLNHVAETSPGIVLLGENVDVDVDEPSVTIRWSILACGEEFLLPGSAGVHGVSACGLPRTSMHIYVDNDEEPTAIYDPSQIPINRGTGQRRTVQNLVQFDSDHVLDVSEARLYPFDTYLLSSTIRAVSFDDDGVTIPIRKLATIDITSSFDTITVDMESFSTISVNGSEVEFGSRDLDMHISRPGEARFFALILFALSWVLTHITVGHVLLARRLSGLRSVLPHLISSGAIVIAIPQLRGTMPDAPGFDGVLIDAIGYFPQMIVSGISTVIILLIVAVREFDAMKARSQPHPPPYYPSVFAGRHNSRGSNSSIISKFPKPPRSPNAHSSSLEIAQYEMHRMLKHLKGQYVFPPVKPSHRIEPSHSSKPSHRKVKTMSKITEHKEVSRWSDHED
ncbi:hypothetical protein CVT24_001364 [Panaeolus cyanescens]|uniref:Transmembrane protein n=1 Tax=Panaeolus cyanescens TaxID=181874 RepID=A0A409VTL3_9AGAR|nr:hypothetical protein CVT24_001364 [Panaeolus cyanescens]